MRLLRRIRDEHRSLAAVIHGLEYVTAQARDAKVAPSFPLLRAMQHYIEAFPEKLHHPKEDAYLFRKLRARTHEFDDTLDELERQHVTGHKLVTDLARSIDAYEADPEGGRAAFVAAAEAFSASQMQHMALEAKVIVPAARTHLTAEDWPNRRRLRRQRRSPASRRTTTRSSASCSLESSTWHGRRSLPRRQATESPFCSLHTPLHEGETRPCKIHRRRAHPPQHFGGGR